MDQLLTMESIERAGWGLDPRATDANRKRLEKAIGRLLNEPGFSESARKIQAGFAEYDARRRFPAIIAAALGKQEADPAAYALKCSSSPRAMSSVMSSTRSKPSAWP